jgi:hypothetical protein
MAASHLPEQDGLGSRRSWLLAWSSLGLSVQASEGWADLPATTRPLQRVQPEAAQSV